MAFVSWLATGPRSSLERDARIKRGCLGTEELPRPLLRGLAVEIGADELLFGSRPLRAAAVTPVGQLESVGEVGAMSP